MIKIVNQNIKKGKETLYHLFINDKFICKFYHNRKDGLDVCLIKASEAVTNDDSTEFINMLVQLNRIKY